MCKQWKTWKETSEQTCSVSIVHTVVGQNSLNSISKAFARKSIIYILAKMVAFQQLKHGYKRNIEKRDCQEAAKPHAKYCGNKEISPDSKHLQNFTKLK